MKSLSLLLAFCLALPAFAAYRVVSVTPVLDTAIYANSDVMFVATEVPSAMLESGGAARLESVEVLDAGNQKVTFDLLFFDSNPTLSFGGLNGAYALSDTDLPLVLGKISVLNADYVSTGSALNAEATYKNIQLMLKSGARSKSLYIGGVVRSGTPTFPAASNLTIRLGLSY